VGKSRYETLLKGDETRWVLVCDVVNINDATDEKK
jgi:hypothetical protein